jgi:M6 family metalloprotease-like protein
MKSKIMFFLIVLFAAKLAFSVSIAPEIVKQLKESGQLQSIVQSDMNARERGVWQPNTAPYRLGTAADIDTLHCLIILVDFSDMTHESGFHSEPPNFDTLLFSQGVRHPGSMTDYYAETSYGKVYLQGQVTQWYRMPQTYAYYVAGDRGFGAYPHNAQKLTEDAVTAADPDVDFSLYDNNGDHTVDALFIVHAGPGYEDTGNLNYIHSHAWVIVQTMNLDSVNIRNYSMEPEETAGNNLVSIGVFCHEFGHVLGLPDLYDYGYDSEGVGNWSVMAGGSWGGGGSVPVHFDAWSKYQLGWAIPTIPSGNITHEQIDAVEYSPDTYQLFRYGEGSQEYFMVENRRRELFDSSLPAEGLLIYHIDESAPNNDDQTHYKVAVEQADGLFDLENNRSANGGDPWPGSSNNHNFDDFSTPNARLYGLGGASEVGVNNISGSDSVMFADLSIMYINPLYQLLDFTFDDSTGNGNGRPEAGETCKIIFSAKNIRASANDLVVTASCTDSQVVFSDSVSNFGILPLNTPFNNQADPIRFSLPAGYTSGFADFILRFSALHGQYIQEMNQSAILGNPNLLLVDDDAGMSTDTFYTNSLQALGRAYVRWDISTQGAPDSVLADYEYVIWFTGNTRSLATPASSVDSLISYLNGGGRLLITSQDFVQLLAARHSVQDTVLLHQYLKVDYNLRSNDHQEQGLAGTIFDSLAFMSNGSGGANNQISQDALTLQPGGVAVMNYRTGQVAAITAVNNYAALTVGFGIEALTNAYPALYRNREEFLTIALRFLEESVSVTESPSTLPNEIALEQNYPNPFNPSTQISFEIPVAGQASLEIFDLLGRLIDRPIDGPLTAGGHQVTWDGSRYASGVYFYKLTVGENSQVKRMTLAK